MLRLHFINVGDGDAILAEEGGDPFRLLVDTGRRDVGEAPGSLRCTAADYLAAQTRLPRGAFRVCPVEDIPRTEAGKTCYARLNGDG